MNDSLLVKQLKIGNDEAFVQLYNQYKKALVFYVKKLTKSTDTAEEIVQQVFISIWMNRESLKLDKSFSAYVYTITKNKVLNFFREHHKNEKGKANLWMQLQEARNNTEEILFGNELKAHLGNAINKLSPQKRQVFLLSREMGKTHSEIATELGISKNTVKNHMVESSKQIKNYLELHYEVAISLLFILSLV